MHTGARFDLVAAAKQAVAEQGFWPEFPAEVKAEVKQILTQPAPLNARAEDLRGLLWSSIDNDTSRDLDQIEYADILPDGRMRVRIGIADVDAYVPRGSAIDRYAEHETVTLYTGVKNFSMLPEELSTGLTSLLEGEDRLCMVTEFVLDANVCQTESCVAESRIYPALVNNKAQLAYPAVGAWLAGRGEAPEKVAASPELQEQLRLQDRIASRLRAERVKHGALNLDLAEAHSTVEDGEIHLGTELRNPATDLIEDFMIAANGVVARTFRAKGIASIRRVVRVPKRWDRIVELAAELGTDLPAEPDARALNDFLCARKEADPDRFPDLSLAVVKLLGPGEYVLERAGAPEIGHFGLAVEDYTHSTAPNRRYADLVTQRLLKAMVAGAATPYTEDELSAIATNCTVRAAAERKLERAMQKRIAAVALADRIGQRFRAIVTGANERGTFVRTLTPHVDGMLVQGKHGLDVGDKIEVKLVHTDPAHGFIDFARA
ncbi:RNB domain-containing ribonuclease [Silvibacterium dinghuense]|uniref:RNB domain-containing ribonuclease n=1 Tax=Silvibacterium dinghuense TaxID=1560006 RepID=A0A4Q1SIV9_9BACT|nr:RNB domain-containing ribonuclease [Silvibacterium dinghuense]RXS97180.1 RNB domain-containing ribonuclease [Silvibacterium dinghuense]GGG96888.1 ribonuclease II [Silvibacterium dinghuense]